MKQCLIPNALINLIYLTLNLYIALFDTLNAFSRIIVLSRDIILTKKMSKTNITNTNSKFFFRYIYQIPSFKD
jgi:hypothetical protein